MKELFADFVLAAYDDMVADDYKLNFFIRSKFLAND